MHLSSQRRGADTSVSEGREPLELAHHTAVQSEFLQVVAELTRVLGRQLVAYLSELREASALDAWSAGKSTPRPTVQARLRLALEAALIVEAVDGRRVAQAWFQGRKPQLDHCAPALVLRDRDPGLAGPAVVTAAKAFIAGG
jgi:hypothetical protein